jgi:hypothetical protein
MDNMTRENDMAQRTGATEPKCGRPAMCWRIFKTHFAYVFNRGGAQGIQFPKAVQGGNLAAQPSCMAGRPDKWTSRAQSSARASPYSSDKYRHALPGRKCEESEV